MIMEIVMNQTSKLYIVKLVERLVASDRCLKKQLIQLDCCNINIHVAKIRVTDLFSEIFINGKVVNVIRCETASTAITAIASAAYLHPRCSLFIVDKECLDCCIRAAMAIDRPERSHFCFLFLPN